MNSSNSINSSSSSSIEKGGGDKGGEKRLLKSDVSPTSMIFRNLLILEDDLRRQYKQQLIIRYIFSLFVLVIISLLIFIPYEYQYITYKIPQLIIQFFFIFLLITLFLFYLSGEYSRTIVLPRNFFQITNKGLKQFNCKLIKPVKKFNLINVIGMNIIIEYIIDFLIKLNTKMTSNKKIKKKIKKDKRDSNSSINFWEYKLSCWKIMKQTNVNNDNDDIKIILNPKIFNGDIREGWEIYRDEFWSRERQRRLNKLTSIYEQSCIGEK